MADETDKLVIVAERVGPIAEMAAAMRRAATGAGFSEGHPQAGRQVRRLPAEILQPLTLRRGIPSPPGSSKGRAGTWSATGMGADRPLPLPLAPGRGRRGRGGPEAPGAARQRRLRCVLGLPRGERVRAEPRPAIRRWDGAAGHRAAPAALLTTPSTGQGSSCHAARRLALGAPTEKSRTRMD